MSFQDIFGSPPSVVATAPGRVNVLGEHTDYNDGYVLPATIPQRTTVSLRPNRGAEFIVHSANLASESRFPRDAAPGDHFASYVYGCIRGVSGLGVEVPYLDIFVQSDVPMGVGLSSSAALEVAVLRALRELLGLDLDDVRIAQIAQRAEIDFAGVHCGIMDQMASSLADDSHLLFLDTRTLERRLVPLPAETELLVVDSGLSRSLAASAYNVRRGECEAAARSLGVPALRDVEDIARVETLDEPQRRRARHVVSENARVAPFDRLLAALRQPYDETPEHAAYAEPAPAAVTACYQTFCGT